MRTFNKPSFYRLAPVSGAKRRALDQSDQRRDDNRYPDRGGHDHVFAQPPGVLPGAKRLGAPDRRPRKRFRRDELVNSVRAELAHQAAGGFLRIESARNALGL